jgi:hypothetical protein
MISNDSSIAGGVPEEESNDLFSHKTISGGRSSNEGDSSIKTSSSRKIQTLKCQKKAEIETRKYELLHKQHSLAKANDESYIGIRDIGQSVWIHSWESWKMSTAVGNQSTINSSGPEANVYGAQISHHEEWYEFDDDSLISLTYITQITNQLHQSRKTAAVYILLPRKTKIYAPTKLPGKTEGNGFQINFHF